MAADAIDAAIDQGEQVEMAVIQVKLISGRPATIALPKDATDLELLHLIGTVLSIGDQLRAARPSSRIIVPRLRA